MLTHIKENLLWIHINKWLSKIPIKVQVLAIIFYLIRINNINVSKIFNLTTRWIMTKAVTKSS